MSARGLGAGLGLPWCTLLPARLVSTTTPAPPAVPPPQLPNSRTLTPLAAPSPNFLVLPTRSAWITVESVNAGWTDDFTAGGPAFISDLCPYDKGSPALMYPEEGEPALQVGLTSGPGCDDEKRDGAGLFVRLADKELLAQLMVWLNSREGTDNSGLDDGVRAWMQAANEYIYS